MYVFFQIYETVRNRIVYLSFIPCTNVIPCILFLHGQIRDFLLLVICPHPTALEITIGGAQASSAST